MSDYLLVFIMTSRLLILMVIRKLKHSIYVPETVVCYSGIFMSSFFLSPS